MGPSKTGLWQTTSFPCFMREGSKEVIVVYRIDFPTCVRYKVTKDSENCYKSILFTSSSSLSMPPTLSFSSQSAILSNLQSCPSMSSHLLKLPVISNHFQPIPVIFSNFQSLPATLSHSHPLSTYQLFLANCSHLYPFKAISSHVQSFPVMPAIYSHFQ